MRTLPKIISALALAITMISCQVNFESTFHSDKTTSMEITMRVDDKIADKQGTAETPEGDDFNGYPIKKLPREWISFYDMKKKFGEPLPTARDSVKFLKAVMVKYDADDEVFKGFSMKINRASEEDLELFSNMFQDMNPGSKTNKEKAKKLDRLDVKWDGKKLIIPTGGDPSKEVSGPEENRTETKAKESLDFFKKAFEGANFVISYRFIFENKIRKIQGEHDFIKKLNDYTVEYKIDILKIMENEAKGKKIRKSDQEIIIIVE